MNGYGGGYYNIIVTQYEPDSLAKYLNDNEVVYDEKEMNGRYQVGSGRIVTITHDTPFIEDILTDRQPNVNSKFSADDSGEENMGDSGLLSEEEFYRLKGNLQSNGTRQTNGPNSQEETVYSIGDIRRRTPHSAGSSGKSGAQKNVRNSSNPIIYTSSGKSQEKTAFEIAMEKAGYTSRDAETDGYIEQLT